MSPRLEYVVTDVETDSGLVGTGLSYTTGVGGTAIVALLEDYCARMLVGEDPLAIGRLWETLGRQLRRSGTGLPQLALAAVDTALWDLAGKHAGLPVHRLLGGHCDSVPAYGSGIDLFLDERELLAHVDELLALGFGWIKIKVGKEDPAEDAARVAAVRRLIGPRRRLCVDANQAWALPDAVRHAAALASAGADLAWLEEPLHPEDVEGHASLRARVPLPVAIGESVYSDSQFLAYLRAGAVDVLQPDLARVGGFTGFLRIAHLAAAHQLPVAPHYLAELTLPALCAIPNGLGARVGARRHARRARGARGAHAARARSRPCLGSARPRRRARPGRARAPRGRRREPARWSTRARRSRHDALQERIAQVRAFIVAGGGGADYHDQEGEHWIDDHIATPMAIYPGYRADAARLRHRRARHPRRRGRGRSTARSAFGGHHRRRAGGVDRRAAPRPLPRGRARRPTSS